MKQVRSRSLLLQIRPRPRLPFQAPVADGAKYGAQSEAFVGELVGQAPAAVGGGDLPDDTPIEQAFKAVAENVCRDAFGGFDEVFETAATEEEVADDQQRPFVTKQV